MPFFHPVLFEAGSQANLRYAMGIRMSHLIQIKENNHPIYPIFIEHSYADFNKMLGDMGVNRRKVCIISDSNVSSHYIKEVKAIVSESARTVETFIFPAGETSKNLSTVNQVYEHLIRTDFERKDLLIALGGGVVGDLTGFIAATYLRGIDFIQMPTSLLAMVDSSIGGKTGVDYLSYKNMVGAFHQPKAVYINTATLSTLSEEQFCSGFGEIVKYGLIGDYNYYQWLKEHSSELLDHTSSLLEEMIYRSCVNKQILVEKDPKEQGERALLNFGHTLGHSIEKLMNFELLHGDCVSIGMVAASYISFMRKAISQEQLDDIIETLKRFKLPTSISNLHVQDIIEGTKRDKKMEAGKIKFILLQKIGKAVIDGTVSEKEMIAALEYIR